MPKQCAFYQGGVIYYINIRMTRYSVAWEEPRHPEQMSTGKADSHCVTSVAVDGDSFDRSLLVRGANACQKSVNGPTA